MKFVSSLSFIMLLCTSLIYADNDTVLIFTHAFNRPDFIHIQKQTFDAFLEDKYELVVFNDAASASDCTRIEQMCQQLGLRCFRVPQQLHARPGRQSPGHRHMDGIQFALDTIGYDYNGIVTLIDSDMFLIKPFSIKKYLEGYDIAGMKEGRRNDTVAVEHFSPLIVFMNMAQLPNKKTLSFEGGYVEGLGCDVGGHSYYYLKNNPSLKLRFFEHLHIGAWIIDRQCPLCRNMSCSNCLEQLTTHHFTPACIQFITSCPQDSMSALDIEFCLNHTFLHYRSGSNWRNMSSTYHQIKTAALHTLLETIVPTFNR